MAEADAWKPPFASIDAEDLKCPACGETGEIQVRAKDEYYAEECEAYCSACHALLEVMVRIDVVFTDPEVVP